jgi:hypothetical protein
VGDFDRDGRLDAVTVNSGPSNFTVLLGDGAGGLGVGSTLITALSPADGTAGDLDRDGRLDLVVASGTSAQIAVHRGGAGASFGPGSLFGTGFVPHRIALADLTRDGYLDLVVVSRASHGVRVFRGTGLGFVSTPLADLDLSATSPFPSAVAVGDWSGDGLLDLAVTLSVPGQIAVYLGSGGGAFNAVGLVTTGSDPRDVFAGDVDGDGRLDLVTANAGSGTVSVLRGAGDGTFAPQSPVAVGGRPVRVALADLDRSGSLDLVVLDDTGGTQPRVVAYAGGGAPTDVFGTAPFERLLGAAVAPAGLALGDFTGDGRIDLVTARSAAPDAVVVTNDSGTTCVRASFAQAPRAWAAGDGPFSVAAADFDRDGRPDLVVASDLGTDGRIRFLRGGSEGFGAPFPYVVSPPARGLAAADFDTDGNLDVVAALGDVGLGEVRLFEGDGSGGFSPGASRPAGNGTSAVAVGDFNGDGAPDVVAVSENDGGVHAFLGDGQGALGPGTLVASGLLTPRGVAAADLTGDGLADLAVTAATGNTVAVFRSNGDGTFTPLATPGVGPNPLGIAAVDLDADGDLDLVTADSGAAQVSVLRNAGSGAFSPAVSTPVDVGPTAIVAFDVTGSPLPDVVVATTASASVNLLENAGGTLTTRTVHPVRTNPQALAPFDVDEDGRLDLAVACRGADSVVVLVARPPAFLAAARVGVGSGPRDATAVDVDGDGDLDLAVANESSDTVSILGNDGSGGFSLLSHRPVGRGPVAIAAGDFDRNGRPDLAVSTPGAAPAGFSLLLASGAPGSFGASVAVPVGTSPDALVAGDFDRDGDLDLAVCDLETAGRVHVLLNDGAGAFSPGASPSVGAKPTAIVAADLDRDGDLDLVTANETSANLSVLAGNGDGTFSPAGTLVLPAGDTTPSALAAGDLDGDGDLDLAAGAFGGDRVAVYRNAGGLAFDPPRAFDLPTRIASLLAADLNQDGRPDLGAAAGGLVVLRGKGDLDFDPWEAFVGGFEPKAFAVGDLDGDGRPDVAMVNATDDVSILRSTACAARRIDVSVQPASCGTGAAPYPLVVGAQVLDDGGNPAACAGDTVTVGIAPGTGDPAATLQGTLSKPLVAGGATFGDLAVSHAGRRYRLQLSAPGLPLARTRSFTLGAELVIQGTPSVCPSLSQVYGAEGSYDGYVWTLDPPLAPFAFTPQVTLSGASLAPGEHHLRLETRVDGCFQTKTLRIYRGILQSTAIQIDGLDTVCVDCIGGTAKAIDEGGGPPVSRDWGYRLVSGGPILPLAGQADGTYLLKGSDFPGPGTYYLVATTEPTCGSQQVSAERAVFVTAVVPDGEVQALSASARGTASLGEVELQWLNSTGAADEVKVRWNKAPNGTSACLPPLDPFVAAHGEATITNPSAGIRDGFLHPGLVLDTAYCYAVFVRVGSSWSGGRTVKARPFDAETGPVKWAYSTGATSVVPPVVGKFGILVMSNDRTLHALTRGAAGGAWPAGWVPRSLTGVAHSRSPIVPFGTDSMVYAGSSVLFAGDDAGDVHAFDAQTGAPKRAPVTPSATATITGAPGALLAQYGGVRDLLLVGTRSTSPANPSDFFGLDLSTGAIVDAWNGSGTMGPVSGTPAVDYGAPQRVYFASRKRLGAGDTVWALDIGAGLPAFTLAWSRDYGEFDTSPVLRGGRLYLGDTGGLVYSLRSSDGLDARSFATADGPVKGFVFPDRRNDDILFATSTKVWSLSDDGSPMTKNWEWTAGVPLSTLLHWPQTSYAYVGGANGTLYQLDFASATPSVPPVATPLVLGDGTGQVGAPSLDIGVDLGGGKRLLVVGTETGVLYGVAVPF